jgi:hypothetical protein
MGVSQQRVSAIENGSVAELATLAAYIRALGGELKVIADFGDSWRRVARRHRQRNPRSVDIEVNLAPLVTAMIRCKLNSPEPCQPQGRRGAAAAKACARGRCSAWLPLLRSAGNLI